MDKKSQKPTPVQQPAKPAVPSPVKKKLSLDVTDVSEVLERKISP